MHCSKLATKRVFIAYLGKRPDFKIFSKMFGITNSENTKIVTFLLQKQGWQPGIVPVKMPNGCRQMSLLSPRVTKFTKTPKLKAH